MVRFIPEEPAGILPHLIHEGTGMKVAEQLHYSYAHGGGWNPMEGFELDKEQMTITYEGDLPLNVVSSAICEEERLYLFEHAFLMIMQPDGSYEIARVD